jgi:hypothetical protein
MVAGIGAWAGFPSNALLAQHLGSGIMAHGPWSSNLFEFLKWYSNTSIMLKRVVTTLLLMGLAAPALEDGTSRADDGPTPA